MMRIREMRMGVCLGLVSMRMTVLDSWLNRLVMRVLMVFVMNMLVFMFQPLVRMLMFMMLSQV